MEPRQKAEPCAAATLAIASRLQAARLMATVAGSFGDFERMNVIDQAIEKLASMKRRKGMHFGDTVREAETFLQGFRQALMATGVSLTCHSEQILESRGWTRTSVGFSPSMRERGLSEAEIMDELIDALVVELRQASATLVE